MSKKLEFTVEFNNDGSVSITLDSDGINYTEMLGCVEHLRYAAKDSIDKKIKQINNQTTNSDHKQHF